MSRQIKFIIILSANTKHLELDYSWANMYRCNVSDPEQAWLFTCGVQGGKETCEAKMGSWNWHPAQVEVAQLGPGDSSDSTCSQNNSITLGLGLGLGVPLLMATGALSWFYLYHKRQMRSLVREMSSARFDTSFVQRPKKSGCRELDSCDHAGAKTSELESNDRQELES